MCIYIYVYVYMYIYIYYVYICIYIYIHITCIHTVYCILYNIKDYCIQSILIYQTVYILLTDVYV